VTNAERADRDNPQRCLICGHAVSVAQDWPVCPACKFGQTSPEAYAIRKARGLLWRSDITENTLDGAPSHRLSPAVAPSALQPLFPLGQIVATPGALAALGRANQPPTEFLRRHLCGDWGALDAHDIAENDYSVAHGFRLLSSYRTTAGETLWIITEADRSATTVLLPEEY